MKKRPKVWTKAQLEIKGTRELLGILKRLHQCEESFEHSAMDVNEDLLNPQIILL